MASTHIYIFSIYPANERNATIFMESFCGSNPKNTLDFPKVATICNIVNS